jgi:hypothetical protein
LRLHARTNFGALADFCEIYTSEGEVMLKSFKEIIPPELDTLARTRERAGKGPVADSRAGRQLQARIIPVLAENFRNAMEVGSVPPRGMEQVLRRLSPEQYAAIVLRVLLNQVYRPHVGAEQIKKKKRGLKPPVELLAPWPSAA